LAGALCLFADLSARIFAREETVRRADGARVGRNRQAESSFPWQEEGRGRGGFRTGRHVLAQANIFTSSGLCRCGESAHGGPGGLSRDRVVFRDFGDQQTATFVKRQEFLGRTLPRWSGKKYFAIRSEESLADCLRLIELLSGFAPAFCERDRRWRRRVRA
jgi:hypothetical protein